MKYSQTKSVVLDTEIDNVEVQLSYSYADGVAPELMIVSLRATQDDITYSRSMQYERGVSKEISSKDITPVFTEELYRKIASLVDTVFNNYDDHVVLNNL